VPLGCRRVSRPGRQQAAGDKVGGDLRQDDRAVVGHTEEAEAGRNKDGIAGKADKGGAYRDYACRACLADEAVDAVLEPVSGDTAVDKGVAGDARHVVKKPQTEQQASHQGRAHAQPGRQSLFSHLPAS